MSDHVVDDLGAYVLGTLSGGEERDVRVHLESCAACRSELTRVQGATELLDSARWAEEPPDDLEDRILLAIGRDPARPHRRRRRLLIAAATVVLVAASFALGLAVGRVRPLATQADQTVSLTGAGGASGTARIYVLASGGRRIELAVSGMPALPPGAAWWVAFSGRTVETRSAGTFLCGPDGKASVVLTVGAQSTDYTALTVTRTDQPDGPYALAGSLQP